MGRKVIDGSFGRKALLISPEAPLSISRVCHDPGQMQRVYDIGRTAGMKSLKSVRKFLWGKVLRVVKM